MRETCTQPPPFSNCDSKVDSAQHTTSARDVLHMVFTVVADTHARIVFTALPRLRAG